MEISSNLNYIKSSNLIFISTALGLINAILSQDIFSSAFVICIEILTLGILIGIGILVRMGKEWIKYVLLFLFLFGLLGLPATIAYLKEYPLNGIITVIVSLFQIWSLILLFIKPKTV
ncbi:hypothetical protein [Flavobacterium subsaxonicum]|uniref:Uncharacterized protein n=1 Tax=Flavobacterium subsaxonicum WB 4.1-42 = DSM 21790 TaxID=1121898 RepID=A0A0A2MJF9_9FLAO|nr:hypothetical protein [Flavobacterium subsaxonicum]KGO92757.1 hypothetical protein Q766_11615 [Flavobacterium subsaxonicum WB 4.1-42 = DSM 21790]